MRILFAIILGILVLTSLTYAHDSSEFAFHGFSFDGKYCTFEVYGYEDYGNGPYSWIYIIDVDKNEYATKPFILFDKRNGSDEPPKRDILEIRKVNFERAMPYLRKFKVDTLEKGFQIFYHDRNNHYGGTCGYIKPVIPQDDHTFSFVLEKETYTLKIFEHNTEKPRPEYDTPKLLELQMIHGNQIQVLQKDLKLPEVLQGALKYELMAAYYYLGKIVVVIDFTTQGFEGKNHRQMVVTGVITKGCIPTSGNSDR